MCFLSVSHQSFDPDGLNCAEMTLKSLLVAALAALTAVNGEISDLSSESCGSEPENFFMEGTGPEEVKGCSCLQRKPIKMTCICTVYI